MKDTRESLLSKIAEAKRLLGSDAQDLLAEIEKRAVVLVEENRGLAAKMKEVQIPPKVNSPVKITEKTLPVFNKINRLKEKGVLYVLPEGKKRMPNPGEWIRTNFMGEGEEFLTEQDFKILTEFPALLKPFDQRLYWSFRKHRNNR